MLKVTDLSITIGDRVLMNEVNFKINPGDKIGLIGRNGAGKTTLINSLISKAALISNGERFEQAEAITVQGEINCSGSFGYLAQTAAWADPNQLALDRLMSSRNISELQTQLKDLEAQMASPDSSIMEKALEKYPKVLEKFEEMGGWQAEAEALKIAKNLKIDDELLLLNVGELSGGQRRRLELARILYQEPETLLLDEPTNHLDMSSIIWLREYLQEFKGGVLVISHDEDLLNLLINRVFHLDGPRQCIDIYNLSYQKYLAQVEIDAEKRETDRRITEKKVDQLRFVANKFRYKKDKAAAAQSMLRRADKMMDALEDVRVEAKVAKLKFPTPAHCGKVPLIAQNLSKSFGEKQIFKGVNVAVDKGAKIAVLGLNGAGKTTLLRIIAQVLEPDSGTIEPGYGLRLGYYAQEHDLIDMNATLCENVEKNAQNLSDIEIRNLLGSFLFSGADIEKKAKVLSGGELTRLALATMISSGANVLLLDEPTNNLDLVSRDQILQALASFEGAIILVTHDQDALRALNPSRVILMPQGTEDLMDEKYYNLAIRE